jgi:outer membrane lipoprotein SlyB
MASNKAIIGLVSTQSQAEAILSQLERAGIPSRDVSVLLPDKSSTRDFAHEKNTKAPEGAVAGASAGGVLGGTLGLLAGIGALAIPGLGPFIAAGPIMAALSGAATGAAVGGIAGALVGMGIPELEAKQYESKIKDGNILMSVHVDDREQTKQVKKILESGGAKDVAATGEQSVGKDERGVARSSY